jgi:hypothetical protein
MGLQVTQLHVSLMMMMMMTKGGQYVKLTTHLHLGARLYLQSSISCYGVALN